MEEDIHAEKWMAENKLDELIIGYDADDENGFYYLSKALSVYSEKIAIEFSEWKLKWSYEYSYEHKGWSNDIDNLKEEYVPFTYYTTSDLFKLFLDSRNQDGQEDISERTTTG